MNILFRQSTSFSLSRVFQRFHSSTKNPADIISEKIKSLESQFDHRLYAGVPFVVRLDGCSFKNYTSGMSRPFDSRLTLSMIYTMNDMIEHTSALLGFTQSDEITLVYRHDPTLNNYPYNGRISKIQSVYSGMASARFNHYIQKFSWDDVPTKSRNRIMSSSAWFDARCFSVPDGESAMEAVYWRHRYDCRRNAIHTVGLANFDSKSLKGLSLNQVIELLEEKNIKIFQDVPKVYLYGVFGKKILVQLPFRNPITGESGMVFRSRLQNRVFDMQGSIEQRTEMIMAKHWESNHQESIEALESNLPVEQLCTNKKDHFNDNQ